MGHPAASGDGRAMGQLVGMVATAFAGGVESPEVTPTWTPSESVPISQIGKISRTEDEAIQALGDKNGCVDCGARSPSTQSGRWVRNHDPQTSMINPGESQVGTPQCLRCMRIQGAKPGIFRELLREGRTRIEISRLISSFRFISPRIRFSRIGQCKP